MNRAVIYVRVSTEEQARDGYSIEAQVNTLKLYAKLYNLKVIKIYKDEGISGKGMDRPQLKNMLEDAKHNLFDVVLIWKISRLSRNLKNLLSIVEIFDTLNISLISQSETFNTSTSVGRMTLQILGSIAEFERNTIIENIKLGLSEKARRGEWLGGRVFGYKSEDKKLIIDEEQAQIVRKIFEVFNESFSICKVQDMLKEKGYKTINNKEFSKSTIYRILANPIYIGVLRHNSKDQKKYYTVKGIHIPIISEELFFDVQKRLLTTSKSYLPKDEFFLSSLLKCPLCSNSLIRYATSGYRYYRCSRYHNYGKTECRGFLVNADKIEQKVILEVKNMLKNSSIQQNLYDILKINEVFEENFADKFSTIDNSKKKAVLRHLIKEILLTQSKEIKQIIYRSTN